MHIGLADFAEPTLLILGDAKSFKWLGDCFKTRQSIDLSNSNFAELIGIGLVVVPTEGEGCLSRNNALFTWNISAIDATNFAEQVLALADSKEPAHSYLDSAKNSAGVQVIASMGEYRPDAVFAS